MPSGQPIDWSLYDDLLIKYLPELTITEWKNKYAPSVSAKAIGVRSKKLGISPSKYVPSREHRDKISYSISTYDDAILNEIRSLRNDYSVSEISKKLNISISQLVRIIKKHNIKLSDDGKRRARQSSTNASIGKIPWNKGKKLPESMLINMAIGRQRMSGRLSKIQESFYRVLTENNINFYKEDSDKCRFGPWTFDSRICHNGFDILVEVQGDYIHSLPKNIHKDKAKFTYIERYFPELSVKYVWEHEFGAINKVRDKIFEWLGLSNVVQVDFNFKDVTFKTITESEAASFLSCFHYLGKLAGRFKIGAFIEDKLIAVSIWSTPTRKETAARLGCKLNECLELRRFVIHDMYHKKNFATFSMARMEKLLPSGVTLVSFADQGVGHVGTIYKASNWIADGETEPSYFYIDNSGYVMLKKTLYNLANGMHVTEKDYAESMGYSKVKIPPKLRFVKHR